MSDGFFIPDARAAYACLCRARSKLQGNSGGKYFHTAREAVPKHWGLQKGGRHTSLILLRSNAADLERRARILKPFEPWKPARGLPNPGGISLPWYQAYNASKHDRQDEFKKANLENLVTAAAGLFVLISSQFRNEDFSAGPSLLGANGHDYHSMEPSIGSLFRIKYPDDWIDAELYDFDWTVLKTQKERFEKIDFDAIPI